MSTDTSNSIHSRLGLLDEDGLKAPRVISLIATVLEKSIQRNEKLLKRSRRRDKATIFHGTKAPTMNIRQYVERIFKYFNCSTSCFVVAYVYMDRFIQHTGAYLTSLNAHRLLIACILVAAKFLEDECYNNAYFGRIGGLSIAEMNKLELKLLLSLEYRLHVSLETFDQYCIHLEEEVGLSGRRGEAAKGSCEKKDRLNRHQRDAEHTCRAM